METPERLEPESPKTRTWKKKQEGASLLLDCFAGPPGITIYELMANECFWAILIELSYLPRWLASKPQTDPQASSLVIRPDQSLTWGNLVYSHCVCVGVFGNFAEKAHQTDVPTDIKGNCEGPTTTLRESSCVSLCKSISKYSMHRYAISLSLFSRYFVDPGLLKRPRQAVADRLWESLLLAGSNTTC